ncbi:hypothetical protein FQN57_001780 [Myotisia sp. PD_48]|nr:hypothetical protein FQN57_001780 [Myotisia sp. PD_48]
MHLLTGLLFLSILPSIQSTLTALAQPTDGNRPNVEIASVSHGGTGCDTKNNGTVNANLSEDGTWLNVTFRDFDPSIGPDIPFLQNRRTCIMGIFFVSDGYEVMVDKEYLQGDRVLKKGVNSTTRVKSYLYGEPLHMDEHYIRKGPLVDQYETEMGIWRIPVYSGCPVRSLTLTTQITLQNITGSTPSTEISRERILGYGAKLTWRKCTSIGTEGGAIGGKRAQMDRQYLD